MLDAYSRLGTGHAADVAATIEHPREALVLVAAFAYDLNEKLARYEGDTDG